MKFDRGWVDFFAGEMPKEYFMQAATAVQGQRDAGKKVYPTEGHIFEAFARTPFADLKVIIIGGAPYSTEGLATGVGFSVPKGAKPTTELTNMYKELNTSLKLNVPIDPTLQSWTDNGIMLMNSVLTVEAGDPKSHNGLGWEAFTQSCVKYISDTKDERVVFALWGNDVHKYAPFIDRKKHGILKAPNPSAGENGFFGCGHFIHINQATRLWE